MLNKNLLAASLFAALAAVAGSANAATLNDDFNITLQVDASCAILQIAGDISMTHDSSNMNLAGAGSTAFALGCNQDLPYTLEVDTQVGGQTLLVDSSTSKTVPVTVRIAPNGNYGAMAPWSTVANGGEYSGVGNGLQEVFEIEASYNLGAQPAAGTYTVNHVVSLTF